MTISPLGDSTLVIGWKDGNLQLVSDESSNQIYFCPINPNDNYTISCQDEMISQKGFLLKSLRTDKRDIRSNVST